MTKYIVDCRGFRVTNCEYQLAQNEMQVRLHI